MDILDSVRSEAPQVADVALLLDSQLSARLSAGIEESFLYEDLRLRSAIGTLAEEPEAPPFGIFGAGVTFIRETPEAAVFVSRHIFGLDAPSDQVVAADLVATPAVAVLEALDVKYPTPMVAVSLPQPIESAISVGDGLLCKMSGTCGLITTWQQKPAVLTAGHVANPVGAPASAGGAPLGTVRFADWLSNNHVPQDIVADVAVIETDPAVQVQPGPAVTGTGTAKQYDEVTAYGQHGQKGGWLRYGLLPNFALTKDKGRWGQVALSDRAISLEGDSGAAVLLSGTTTVIGHVVAGAGNAFSVIQDISFIANAAGVVVP